METRESIRLKATTQYLLKISAVVVPIILLFAFIAWVSNLTLIKGLFLFYVAESIALYMYMLFNIYMEEFVLNQNIMNDIVFGKVQEYENVMLHSDGDFKIVIPRKNIELLKRMPDKFVFLDKSDWLDLYKILITKHDQETKMYMVYFDSEKAKILMLRRHYYRKEDRYYLV